MLFKPEAAVKEQCDILTVNDSLFLSFEDSLEMASILRFTKQRLILLQLYYKRTNCLGFNFNCRILLIPSE